jgi:hypothetical protein
MPMKLDDLLRDERVPKDENELDNWEQRIFKFFIDNIRLKKAYTESEIFIAMTQKYRNPLPTQEIIKSVLTELVAKKRVVTKIHENIPYYWVE